VSVLDSLVRSSTPLGEFCWIGVDDVEHSQSVRARRYRSLSNDGLWPLYHDAAVLPSFDERDYESYAEVNSQVAEAILRASDSGALVWIHDFHLQLAPALVRRRASECSIGFSLHIPFPPAEVFARIPWRTELLLGILGADLVGFQTQRDLRNFREACSSVLGVPTEPLSVLVDGRHVSLGCFPVGIDQAEFRKLANDDDVQRRSRQLSSKSSTVLLSVDRLDYTKGVERRLETVIDLMRSGRLDPATHEFIQVAVPTRQDSADYRRVAESFAERMESCGDLPISWRRDSLDRAELVAHYLAADVLIVTPFRDGMNLVSKEYIAVGGGELILSEFAGASHELTQATIVNPFNTSEVATAIVEACGRVSTAKDSNHRIPAMVSDVHQWGRSFLEQLHATSLPVVQPVIPFEILLSAEQLLICVDYDGTIAPLVDDPAQAIPHPEAIGVLEGLANLTNVDVAIVSGRNLQSLQALAQVEDSVILIGSYGAEDARHQVVERVGLAPHEQMLFDQLVAETAMFEFSFDGVRREIKWNSVALHTRGCTPTISKKVTREVVRGLGQWPGVTLRHGKDVVEVSVSEHEKAGVVELLRIQTQASAVLYIGDDVADESVFEMFSDSRDRSRVGVHVGNGPSLASVRISSPNEVVALLQTLYRLRQARGQRRQHVD